MITICIGYEKEQILPDAVIAEDQSLNNQTLKGAKKQKAAKITGSVELVWKGGEKGNEKGKKPENLLAFIQKERLYTVYWKQIYPYIAKSKLLFWVY